MMQALALCNLAALRISEEEEESTKADTAKEKQWDQELKEFDLTPKDVEMRMALSEKKLSTETLSPETILQFCVINLPTSQGKLDKAYIYVTNEMLRTAIDRARDMLILDYDNIELASLHNCVTRDIIPRSLRLVQGLMLAGEDEWSSHTRERDTIALHLGSGTVFRYLKLVLGQNNDMLAYVGFRKFAAIRTIDMGDYNSKPSDATRPGQYYGRPLHNLRTPARLAEVKWRQTHTGKDALGWLRLRLIVQMLLTSISRDKILEDNQKYEVLKQLAHTLASLTEGDKDTAAFLITNSSCYIPVQDMPIGVIAPYWVQIADKLGLRLQCGGRKYSEWSGYQTVSQDQVQGVMPVIAQHHLAQAYSFLQKKTSEFAEVKYTSREQDKLIAVFDRLMHTSRWGDVKNNTAK